MTYRRALAGGHWPLKTWLLKSGGLSGLLLVAFSISFAMAISSLVARSFKSIRWIAWCPKRPLVCLRMALYFGACSSPFSRAMSDKCSRAAIAEWTSNTPGGRDRSCRRFWRAWLTVFSEIFFFTASIPLLTSSKTSGAAWGNTKKRRINKMVKGRRETEIGHEYEWNERQ